VFKVLFHVSFFNSVQVTDKAVAVGFGISTPEHVSKVNSIYYKVHHAFFIMTVKSQKIISLLTFSPNTRLQNGVRME
jgi:hypothetical protein